MNALGFIKKEAASKLNKLTWEEIRNLSGAHFPALQELGVRRAGLRPGSTFLSKEPLIDRWATNGMLNILPNSVIPFGSKDAFNKNIDAIEDEARDVLKRRNEKNGDTEKAEEFEKNKNIWNDGTWYDKAFIATLGTVAGVAGVAAIGAGVYAAYNGHAYRL